MPLSGDAKREYQNAWIKRRRQEWIDEHGPCVDCGKWEDAEVDHQDASIKLMNPSRLWSLALTNPVRIAELAKCVVRCTPCHINKTTINKERASGEQHGHAKLTHEQVDEARRRYESGEGIRPLAREYGVDRNTLRAVLRRITWK